MENKYQEALNKIKRFFGENSPYNKELNIIQELINKESLNKEIPKIVITKSYMSATQDIYGNYLKTKNLCSSCKKEIDYSSYEYCPHCGQKLDWGDDGE